MANHEGIRKEGKRARGQLNQQPPKVTSPSTTATEAATPLRSSTAGHTTLDSLGVWPTRKIHHTAAHSRRPLRGECDWRPCQSDGGTKRSVHSSRRYWWARLLACLRTRTLDPRCSESCLRIPGYGDSGALKRYLPPSGGATESFRGAGGPRRRFGNGRGRRSDTKTRGYRTSEVVSWPSRSCGPRIPESAALRFLERESAKPHYRLVAIATATTCESCRPAAPCSSCRRCVPQPSRRRAMKAARPIISLTPFAPFSSSNCDEKSAITTRELMFVY